MYAVSDAWVAANDHFLAPEGFVELSCYIPELNETLVYTKNDLMSFTHQQTGSLVSGELPKNHIEFTLDNSDGKWNPSNPTGLERYLSERLRIILRYGQKINGEVEWIPGGVFYLSEWTASPGSAEAHFVARDLLEYMLDKPYTGAINGTLFQVASDAVFESGIPNYKLVILGSVLKDYTVRDLNYDGKTSIAEILQKCANAAGCVIYQNRVGALVIDKLVYEDTGYTIPKKFSYHYPEIDFYRPLKNVSVTYGDDEEVLFQFGGSGETQTVNNDFIETKDQAAMVAKWVTDSLRTRKVISGSFRCDPRLDLFDVVQVENKYGTVAGVVLTDISYSFSGAFHATYSGYIRGSGTAVVVYCGEKISGEVS